jgi:hypothetical protein
MPPLPGDTIGVAAWPMADGSFLLNDINFDYNAVGASPMRMGMTSVDGPPFFGGGDDGTNEYSPDGSSYTPPDFGTNLWIANTAVAFGYLTGIGSNTLPAVSYTILSLTNLLQAPNWQYEGTIVGSELTNWTPLSVAQGNRTNLFVRLRSELSSDGTGLPDWWEQLYFGTNDVDPDAQDLAGDGYTIYQKYMLGVRPDTFLTPPKPMNFTATYNAVSGYVTLNWSPSPGPVTAYRLRTSHGSYVYTSGTSYSEQPSLEPYWTYQPYLNVSYSLQAQYGANYSPSVTASLTYATIPQESLVTGPQGQLNLVIPNPPDDLSNVWIYIAQTFPPWDYPAIRSPYDEADNLGSVVYPPLTNGYFAIPASSVTNGVCQILAPQASPYFNFSMWAQTERSNGISSAFSPLGNDALGGGAASVPFIDARRQLKDNLIFLLRAATDNSPFAFSLDSNGEVFAWPYTLDETNYIFAGFYSEGWGNDYGSFNEFLPIHANCFYKNFVFDPSNLNPDGSLNTGCSGGGGYASYWGNGLPCLNISNYPTNYFNLAAFLTNNAPIPPSQIASSHSQWIMPNDSGVETLGGGTFTPGEQNYYGLTYLSKIFAYVTNNELVVQTCYPGDNLPSGVSGVEYNQTTEPILTNTGYYFAAANYGPVPEQPNFLALSTTPTIMVGVGTSQQIAGYAQYGIQNGYSNTYAYLGQYFANAYAIDGNGNITTTPSGILSPYGDFFATTPGPVALVTMPDIDTGKQGTCTVYCVSLVLDKNHDLVMDKSFNGPDATSQSSPFVFWINDDYDYSGASWDLGQDVQASWYYNDGYQQKIESQRDLEDYARLWICGMPALTNGNYQVTLSWTNVSSGSPTINLFNTVEINGGVGYLTNLDIATAQLAGADNFVLGGPGRAIATISPGQPFTFPASYFTNAGDKHFLFDGAITNGAGELLMTIADNSGNTIAQTSAWLDLHHIDDFFEQAVITNKMSGAKSNWTSSVEIVQPAVSSALGDDQDLIVLVHGINVKPWDCVNDAETVCKRLYWAGYHGKFAEVEWPCNLLTPIPSPLSPAVFNDSELQGYKASQALTTYLTQLRARFPGYRLHLLVHSQGNAVVSEAIRSGVTFDTYILTQGALPASAYDVNAPVDSDIASYEGSRPTPEWQPMGYRGIYTNFTGRIVNFYNSQDGVLNYWVTDQKLLKPSVYFDTSYYFYNGTNSYFDPPFSANYLVTDPEESRADVSRSRTLPIGQSGPASGHGVIQSAVDLNANFGFNSDISEHSAQWTRPIQTSRPYFQQVLRSCQIIPAP